MNVYDLKVKNVNQEEVSLSTYKGKVVLIVNTATKCGLTPQYEGLEKLYQKYKKKGFEILDFPCNQFMNQAPGSDEEISSFCELNYQTTFTRFAKLNVNGKDADPLYKYLKKAKSDDYSEKSKFSLLSLLRKKGEIKWNFTKFLVNQNGEVIYRFSPAFLPKDIEKFIEGVL
jgi:glutathione peroxidase